MTNGVGHHDGKGKKPAAKTKRTARTAAASTLKRAARPAAKAKGK